MAGDDAGGDPGVEVGPWWWEPGGGGECEAGGEGGDGCEDGGRAFELGFVGGGLVEREGGFVVAAGDEELDGGLIDGAGVVGEAVFEVDVGGAGVGVDVEDGLAGVAEGATVYSADWVGPQRLVAAA